MQEAILNVATLSLSLPVTPVRCCIILCINALECIDNHKIITSLLREAAQQSTPASNNKHVQINRAMHLSHHSTPQC
jgi:hypothetical protein